MLHIALRQNLWNTKATLMSKVVAFATSCSLDPKPVFGEQHIYGREDENIGFLRTIRLII